MADDDEAPGEARDRRQLGEQNEERHGWIWFFALVELIGIVLFATGRAGSYRAFLGVLGAALLIAVAAMAAGGVFGLLVGLGRSRAPGRPSSALAELSDWLPLVVLGAVLIGFGNLTNWIGLEGSRAGAALGLDGEPGAIAGVSVIVFNVLFGFLAFFLYTRPSDRPAALPAGGGSGADARTRVTDTAASILGALYQPAPNGYERAIREARAFLREPANERNATIWMYLACAYGQKYAALQSSASATELRQLVRGTLDAVRKARRFDPELKDAMRALWDPNDENHIEGENDLQPFYDDARLRELFDNELL